MHNTIHLVPPGLAGALVRNAVADLLQPYLRYVEGWQLRLGYLGGQLTTQPVATQEYDIALKRLEELRREIESSRRALVMDASQLPPDERIEVTRAELEQLLADISALRRRS